MTKASKTQPRAGLNKKRGDQLFSLILILPTLLVTAVFILVPVVDSVIKSFTDFRVRNIISGQPGEWNNFENYIRLFNGGKLLPAIVITLSFVVGVVLVQFILGMALALILNSNVKCARFIRSIMMMPWVVPTIISALIWMWIFQPQYGLLKYFVGILTGGAVTDFAILNNPDTALVGVAIAALWKQIPLTTLLLLSGLQNVPDDMLEAATIDGASRTKKFFAIVIPYMKSVISIVVSMAIIENFKQFPLIWTMTGRRPQREHHHPGHPELPRSLRLQQPGAAARAVTTIWMLLMIVVVFVYNKLFPKEDMS